ncbi:MAG: glutathione S-transferase C-terminal domain-containing protein [Pseudomonadales bacterium]
MVELELSVLSLRYSSWSMRPWLALSHAGADFRLRTAELPEMQRQQRADDGSVRTAVTDLSARRRLGSVTGLFPVLRVDGAPIHEALAICEWVADAYPDAGLWPRDALQRAQDRAVCAEMASGFAALRAELSCHLFARVPDFEPSAAARRDIDRVFEIWDAQLERHGGRFLGGGFGVVDCMYFPVLSRFRSYGVALPARLEDWAREMEASAPVRALSDAARVAPRIEIYDDYVRNLGGDPDAALKS